MYRVSSSADSKYFSRLINLIGSMRLTNNCISEFEVWDLGLTKFQIFILRKNGILVKKMPVFAPHWNQCYSWKLCVFKESESELFFHLDAGNIVKGDLTHVFKEIDEQGYFLIDQGQLLHEITPVDYPDKFGSNVNIDETVFAAGNIGLNKKKCDIKRIIDEAYKASLDGYCLGFSEKEMFRDTEGIGIVRDCKLFRHDQTLINLIFRKIISSPKIHDHKLYASVTKNLDSNAIIINNRGYCYNYITFFTEQKFKKILIIYCHLLDLKIRIIELLKRKLRAFNR